MAEEQELQLPETYEDREENHWEAWRNEPEFFLLRDPNGNLVSVWCRASGQGD